MNSAITGKPMQRTTRTARITIRGAVVNIEEECWTCQESDAEFTDEAQIKHNLDQAWAAYWAAFPLSDLLTMRQTAMRDIAGIDRAIADTQFAEKLEAVTFQIDREILARFKSGEYISDTQWWCHGPEKSHLGPVTEEEFDAIKRLTDQGLLKKETR